MDRTTSRSRRFCIGVSFSMRRRSAHRRGTRPAANRQIARHGRRAWRRCAAALAPVRRRMMKMIRGRGHGSFARMSPRRALRMRSGCSVRQTATSTQTRTGSRILFQISRRPAWSVRRSHPARCSEAAIRYGSRHAPTRPRYHGQGLRIRNGTTARSTIAITAPSCDSRTPPQVTSPGCMRCSPGMRGSCGACGLASNGCDRGRCAFSVSRMVPTSTWRRT